MHKGEGHFIQKLNPFRRIGKLADRRGYTALVAFLAAVDAFVLFVPNEVLLIPAVLARRKFWIGISLWVSLGSAIGATLFGYLVGKYGEVFIHSVFPSILNSDEWRKSVQVIQDHGTWGLAVISISPLPQHAAVAIAGLAHLSLKKIFISVLVGRAIKYLVVSWCALHAPRFLKRLPFATKNVGQKG